MVGKDGGAAFPVCMDSIGGMSLRDYFAAQVICMAAHDLTRPEDVAERAYAIADAMLAAREKQPA